MNHLRRTLLLALTACAFVVGPAKAQDAADTPAQFAQRYFEKLKAGDWSATAHLMHPEALNQLVTLFRSVAGADPSGQLTDKLGMSPAELDSLSAEEVYTRLLSRGQPEVGEMLARSSMEVIGDVADAKSGIDYVVYRTSMPFLGSEMTQVSLLPLKKLGQEWRAMLTGDAAAMAGAFGGRPK